MLKFESSSEKYLWKLLPGIDRGGRRMELLRRCAGSCIYGNMDGLTIVDLKDRRSQDSSYSGFHFIFYFYLSFTSKCCSGFNQEFRYKQFDKF